MGKQRETYIYEGTHQWWWLFSEAFCRWNMSRVLWSSHTVHQIYLQLWYYPFFSVPFLYQTQFLHIEEKINMDFAGFNFEFFSRFSLPRATEKEQQVQEEYTSWMSITKR